VPSRQSPPQPVTVERRRFTFTPPPCKSCTSSQTEVATRTDYVLYIRCRGCLHVWSVPKPGREQIAASFARTAAAG
jgi:hypothetical protein